MIQFIKDIFNKNAKSEELLRLYTLRANEKDEDELKKIEAQINICIALSYWDYRIFLIK